MAKRFDCQVENHGSIFLFVPLTKRMRRWLEVNTAAESMWYGGALAVEHRYAWDLAQAVCAEGFRVR